MFRRSIHQLASRSCSISRPAAAVINPACISVFSKLPAHHHNTRHLATAAHVSNSENQSQSFKASSVAPENPDLTYLKLDSNGSKDLYAIFKLHNMPYLVTKGDKVILPFKLKNVEVGDQLVLDNVTTLGSPEFTYTDNNGIPSKLFDLKASVTEITREPYYEVYRKKKRCRRIKTFPVQNHQTHITINELKLR